MAAVGDNLNIPSVQVGQQVQITKDGKPIQIIVIQDSSSPLLRKKEEDPYSCGSSNSKAYREIMASPKSRIAFKVAMVFSAICACFGILVVITNSNQNDAIPIGFTVSAGVSGVIAAVLGIFSYCARKKE